LSFLDRLIPSRKAEPNDVVVSSVLNATTQTGTAFPDASYSNFAREGYAGNELVFACIREIATSSSEAFLRYYDRDGEVLETSPVSNLIDRPAPGLTQYEFLENLITHLHIAGNAYVLKERARVGIVSLLLLRPDRSEALPGRGYQYYINGARYIIPAEDIGHLKFPNPNNDYYGLSPLQVLAKQVNLDSDATKFTKAFFTNAGVPSGILKLRRKLSSQDEASKLRAAWRGHFQGTRNWHRIAILDEDASYETMGSGIGDMEIPSLRALSETRICSALGVPAILVGANVGLQRSTYSNYGEARESFWEETLLPMYRRVEQFISELLLPEFPSEQGRIAFDFSEVRALQEDEGALVGRQLVRAQITKEFINAGFTPAAALSAAGISDELEHTGFLPTTLAVRGLQAVEIKGEQKALTQAAANRILDPLAESYEEETETMERVLEKFFREQLNRADGVMGRYLSLDDNESKDDEKIQMPFNEITLIPYLLDDELKRRMSPVLVNAFRKSWNVINGAGVFREMPFDAELPIFQNVIRGAGTKINDVSRFALREQIQLGTNRGYSLDQIVRGVPKDQYRGLRKVVRETYKNRAKTIARTEVATAQNTATAARYKAAGVAHVIIQDGDDDELCAPFSGTTQTIDWALENPIAHPNCTRAYSAIIDGVTE